MKIARTQREDGIVISTVKPNFMAWYGTYETAISFDYDEETGLATWYVAEGYETEEEALKGHEKYSKMTKEELENKNDYIG